MNLLEVLRVKKVQKKKLSGRSGFLTFFVSITPCRKKEV